MSKPLDTVAPAAAALPGVFAGFFVSTPPAIAVEPGHYDAKRQLYVSERTGQPAYVSIVTDGKHGAQRLDTTGSTCSITTMTGKRDAPDDHSDTVQDDFD